LLFEHASGIQTEAGILIGTLVFGAAFFPVRDRVQAIVDKYYGPAPSRELVSHNDRLRSIVRMLDPNENAQEFLTESVDALGAMGGAVYFYEGEEIRRAASTDPSYELEAIPDPNA
jgi:hypothetical protein